MKHFTKKEDAFLLNNYLKIPAKRMSKILGRSESSARQRMMLLGIVVPPEIIQKFKDESRFKPGCTPPNKGRKQSEYMSAKAINISKKTRFKKGRLPHNTKKDGAISIRTDKRGVQYKFIRVAISKWVPLQRWLWEKNNGPIPKGGKIIFIDGDTMNYELQNLQLITTAGLMVKNSYHNWPKPLADMVQLRGALNRQINKRSKLLTHEK